MNIFWIMIVFCCIAIRFFRTSLKWHPHFALQLISLKIQWNWDQCVFAFRQSRAERSRAEQSCASIRFRWQESAGGMVRSTFRFSSTQAPSGRISRTRALTCACNAFIFYENLINEAARIVVLDASEATRNWFEFLNETHERIPMACGLPCLNVSNARFSWRARASMVSVGLQWHDQRVPLLVLRAENKAETLTPK